jgi:DNA-binding MarR family transcriptional regulator
MKGKTAKDAPVEPRLPGKAELLGLAAFRWELRRYMSFAAIAADHAGVTMQQHQALLAIAASEAGRLTIGELAESMFVRHHSAVELSDRLSTAGLVRREKDQQDARRVALVLTEAGERTLATLAEAHLRELRESGPALVKALNRVLNAK